jgi:hypothetical protein
LSTIFQIFFFFVFGRGIYGMNLSNILQEIIHEGVDITPVSMSQAINDYEILNHIYDQSVMSDDYFRSLLHHVSRFYNPEVYYAKDNDELVGFLVKSRTTLKKDILMYQQVTGITPRVGRDVDIDRELDVCLMVAVDKKHRGKGIFNRLIQLMDKPYYTQLNTIFSPLDIWKKQGFVNLIQMSPHDFIGVCGQSTQHLNEMVFPIMINKNPR